jgi:hypothetical protein
MRARCGFLFTSQIVAVNARADRDTIIQTYASSGGTITNKFKCLRAKFPVKRFESNTLLPVQRVDYDEIMFFFRPSESCETPQEQMCVAT